MLSMFPIKTQSQMFYEGNYMGYDSMVRVIKQSSNNRTLTWDYSDRTVPSTTVSVDVKFRFVATEAIQTT